MVTLSPDTKLMTPAQSGDALRFAEAHKTDEGTVVVHSESGISRNPIVAAVLRKAIGGDDGGSWRDCWPNQHVYSCILAAYQAGATAACCWSAAETLHRRTRARIASPMDCCRTLAANPSKVSMSVRGRPSPQEGHRVSVHLCH